MRNIITNLIFLINNVDMEQVVSHIGLALLINIRNLEVGMNGLGLKGLLVGLLIGGATWCVLSVVSAFAFGALISMAKRVAK